MKDTEKYCLKSLLNSLLTRDGKGEKYKEMCLIDIVRRGVTVESLREEINEIRDIKIARTFLWKIKARYEECGSLPPIDFENPESFCIRTNLFVNEK